MVKLQVPKCMGMRARAHTHTHTYTLRCKHVTRGVHSIPSLAIASFTLNMLVLGAHLVCMWTGELQVL